MTRIIIRAAAHTLHTVSGWLGDFAMRIESDALFNLSGSWEWAADDWFWHARNR